MRIAQDKGLDSLLQFLDTKSAPVELKQIREIEPVSKWITSEYYLGKAVDSVWSYWRDKVVEFFETGKNEIIFTGGIGTGKSNTANIITARTLYELSCYNFPAMKFNLAPTSKLTFAYLSVTLKQANDTGFGEFRRLIDQSPYFQECFQRNMNKSTRLVFPNESVEMFAGSNESHFIGTNLYLIGLDEANFVNAGGGDAGKVQKAMNIYREASNRRTSRFLVDGKEFGIRMLVSSSDTVTSFVESRIAELQNDPSTMIVHARKYDIKPENYSKQRFWVFKGDSVYAPFVVEENNKEKYKVLLETKKIPQIEQFMQMEPIHEVKIPEEIKSMFIDIPVNSLNQFRMDCYGSLKEVAGVSMSREGRLFADIDKYSLCINPKLRHPFTTESIKISTKDEKNMLIENLLPEFMGVKGYKYYFGLDLSLSGNNTGIALGHMDENGHVIIDFMLKITPPANPDQINIEHIKEFILYLVYKREFHITDIICDNFQSAEFIQFFKKLNYNARSYSVEKEEPYLYFTNKISLGEVEFYYYEPFKYELFNLVHDRKSRKIDHQLNMSGGKEVFSKDISDAVCRIVYNMFSFETVPLMRRNNNLIMGLSKLWAGNGGRRIIEDRDFVLKDEAKFLGVDVKDISKA